MADSVPQTHVDKDKRLLFVFGLFGYKFNLLIYKINLNIFLRVGGMKAFSKVNL